MSTYALIKNAVVENIVVWDGVGDLFEEYEVVNIDGTSAGIGWEFYSGILTPPPELEPEPSELIRLAMAQKLALIDRANEYINGKQWPSRLSLGRLTDGEKTAFNNWLEYLEALENIDATMAPSILWPTEPS